MSILQRAKKAATENARKSAELEAYWDQSTSARVARGLNYQFGFEPPIKPEELTKMAGGWERSLWGVEREGIAFIAGDYWHGNPGNSFYVGARRGRLKRVREWPPPGRPIALQTQTWAPSGYRPTPSLAALARLA